MNTWVYLYDTIFLFLPSLSWPLGGICGSVNDSTVLRAMKMSSTNFQDPAVERTMNLKDFFSIVDQFKYIQGNEGKLRRRRRNGLLATIATTLLGVFEILRELSLNNEFILEYLSRVANHTLYTIQFLLYNLWLIITLQWESLQRYRVVYDVLGIYVVILGIVIYILNRHTAFLFSISEEPFQYTFWIDRFNRAEDREENTDSITADDKIHHLLHHDLMDMLNRRIGRFSLLDEKFFDADADPDDTPPSHIHVDGHYAIRERKTEGRTGKIIRVMPRVRIGPPGNPSILTRPVEFEVVHQPPAQKPKSSAENETEKEEKAQDYTDALLLNEEDYRQVLEQVYSKVASEIYKQIRSDIKRKIHFFPTKYLRAVALFYEARDFSRSNTIDSYDYAIELYKESLRYYDISFRSVLSNWLLRLFPFRFGIEYVSMHARTKIGYAKCLGYRREISSYTGRAKNAIYEVPVEIHRVVKRLIQVHNKFHIGRLKIDPVAGEGKGESDLEKSSTRNRLRLTLTSLTYKKDTWKNRIFRRKMDLSRFEKLKKLLFHAYVVLAFAYAKLGDTKKAAKNLEFAKATYPEECDRNALFLLTKADAELDLESKIPLLTQSTEMAPDFEIAQYLLAKTMLYVFLSKGEINKERAKPALKELNKVLEINPGNIASFANLGHLYWLIDNPAQAKKQFEQGIDSKAIVQQTYIGELNYGLARIAAKHGEFNECYDLYSEALSSEPSLGAYSTESIGGKTRLTSYYDYITLSAVERYEEFKRNFEDQITLVLVTFYPEDIDDLQGLVTAVSEGDSNASKYIKDAISKTRADQSGKMIELSADEFVAKLNTLLSDGDFHKVIVQHDKALAQLIDELKQRINYQADNESSLANLNRLILETLFSKFIGPSRVEEYFEGSPCRRQNFKDGQESISINTINKAYSYVLNDYGNACLTYYHRSGDSDRLDEAKRVFERAIELNPENGIAYYNIANAVIWRYRNSDEGFWRAKEYLEKAVENMLIPWPRVIIEVAKYQMQAIRRTIREEAENIRKLEALGQEIEDLNKRIEQRKESLEKADEFMPSLRPLESIRGEEELEAFVEEIEDLSKRSREIMHEDFKPLETKGQPLEDLDQVLDYAKRIGDKTENNVLEKRGTIRRAETKFESEFISAIKRIIELSNLAAIIEGYGIDSSGSSIEELMNIENEIEPDRFTEKDIEVLRGWSHLLCTNWSNEQAVKAAVKLCKFIAKYTPSAFEVDLILYHAFQNLEYLELEEILRNYKIDELIDQNDLENIYGKLESEELVKRPPGAILEGDKGKLNRVKTKLGSTFFFKPGDIRDPKNLLWKMANVQERLSNDSETDSLTALQLRLRERGISAKELALELARILNRLIKFPLHKKGLDLDQISHRTLEMIEFEDKLKGDDLIRLNRMLLEEAFPKEITKNKVERYRERICETIRHEWLASDPIHYLALDEWAKSFLIFPEMEQCLKEAIRRAPTNADEFHKGLANLYEKPGYEDEAEQNFELAIKENNEYRQQGIYHLKLSQALRRNHKYEGAIDRIQKAKEKGIIDETEHDNELKAILIDEANYLAQEDWGDAVTKYQEALAIFPTDEDIKRDLERAISEYKRQKIVRHYGQKWVDQLLVVTPIAIEVARDLIPLVAEEEGGLREPLLDSIDEMRERLLGGFGVRVPGIRFRGNELDFPNGTYVIMINEIPLASGYIPLGKGFYTGSKEFEALSIQFDETTDPVTDEMAYWIDEGDTEELKARNMPFWEGEEYLIRHLEAILQRNLVEFLGHQEVYNLIGEKCPEKLECYDSHPEDLIRLTAVLRGLIGENVPITAFRAIVEFVEQHKGEPSISNLINDVRLLPEVRKDLPGNRNICDRFKLSVQIEEKFHNAVYEENGRFVLAMPPEMVQEVVAAVRSKVRNRTDEAIIVANTLLRPLVNQLLKLEFSNTSVISQDEMLDIYGNGSREIEEIDFE